MANRLLSYGMTMTATLLVAVMSACGGDKTVNNGELPQAENFADSLTIRYGTQWGAAQNLNIAMLPEGEMARFDKDAYLAGLRAVLETDALSESMREGIGQGVAIAEQIESYAAVGIPMNRAIVLTAMKERLGSDTLGAEEYNRIQGEYDVKMSAVQNKILEKIRNDRREQLMMNRRIEKGNLQAAEAFIAKEKKADASIVTTESGLHYKIIQQGNGQKPSIGRTVRLTYTIKGLDGRVIDSSRGETIDVVLDNSLIAGLLEGLQLMEKGTKTRFYIPSSLGFGRDNTSVRPGEMIIVETELVDIL